VLLFLYKGIDSFIHTEHFKGLGTGGIIYNSPYKKEANPTNGIVALTGS
jgi:hypothetical protein